MSIVKGSSERDKNKYVFIRLKHSNIELLKAPFYLFCTTNTRTKPINPLNAELNPICHLLALVGGATIVVVSRLRVNILHLINALPSGFLRTRDTQNMFLSHPTAIIS